MNPDPLTLLWLAIGVAVALWQLFGMVRPAPSTRRNAAPSTLGKMNPTRCVWLDLETTGLDPFAGRILEVAIVVTDERFTELARFVRQIHVKRDELNALCNDYVRNMHEANGLFAECMLSLFVQSAVEKQARDFLARHGALQAPLCGNSVHFDRAWLESHMPSLASDLHYRTFDASSLRVGLVGIGGPWLESPKRVLVEHRALADVLSSIALAKLALDYGAGWRAMLMHVRAMGRVLRRMTGWLP